jgi:PAS domain S-box-containing protein
MRVAGKILLAAACAVGAVALVSWSLDIRRDDLTIFVNTPAGTLLILLVTIASLACVIWAIARRLRGGERPAETVRDSDERFRLAIEAAPTGMLMIDPRGTILLVNAEIERIFGYQRDELVGQPLEILLPERFRALHPELRRSFANSPQARVMAAGRDLFGRRRDGSEVVVEIGLNPIATGSGRFVLASIVDVTERKTIEADRTRLLGTLRGLARGLEDRVERQTVDIRESEASYRTLFDDSPIALWEADFSGVKRWLVDLQASGVSDLRRYLTDHPDLVAAAATHVKIRRHNRRALELFDAPDSSTLMDELRRTQGTAGLEHFRDQMLAMLEGRVSYDATIERHTLSGRQIFMSLRVVIVTGHESTWSRLVGSMTDITANTLAERRLRTALDHQETLVKEIHHRVKNNLAVISSLFFLESTHASEPRTIEMLEESRRRVRSMALVHETLYRSDQVDEVAFDEYVRALAEEIFSTYKSHAVNVRLDTDIEPFTLGIDQAGPCGLILNELLTNAFKHAFPDGRSGTIAVSLRETNGDCHLVVSDDGVGLPQEMQFGDTSLGLRLIRSLARQLRATVIFERTEPGTTVRIVLSDPHDLGPTLDNM